VAAYFLGKAATSGAIVCSLLTVVEEISRFYEVVAGIAIPGRRRGRLDLLHRRKWREASPDGDVAS